MNSLRTLISIEIPDLFSLYIYLKGTTISQHETSIKLIYRVLTVEI